MSKKFLWGIVSFLLIAVGCDKDDEQRAELPSDFIQGKWQIEVLSNVIYPYFQKGDIFYFEDEQKLEIISKMVIKENYLLDKSDQSIQFQSQALSVLGKFDVKIDHADQIQLLPRMFKGKVSLQLQKLPMPTKKDIVGKWKITSLEAYQLKENKMHRTSIYDKMPPSEKDNIYEFLEDEKGVLWEDANTKKKDAVFSYLLKNNHLTLKLSEKGIDDEEFISLLKIDKNTLRGKWTEVNSANEVITNQIVFSRVK